MRSTSAGIAASVSTIRCSSSRAGTTTPTRFPSSTPETTLDHRLPQERGEGAEQQPDQPADDDRVARRACRRLDGDSVLPDVWPLDLFCKGEKCAGVLAVLFDQSSLLFQVVELADQHELIEDGLV